MREAQELPAIVVPKEMTGCLQQSLVLVHLLLVEVEAREAFGPLMLPGMMAAVVAEVVITVQAVQELPGKATPVELELLLVAIMVEAVEAEPERQATPPVPMVLAMQAMAAREQIHIRRGLQQLRQVMEDSIAEAVVAQDTYNLVE